MSPEKSPIEHSSLLKLDARVTGNRKNALLVAAVAGAGLAAGAAVGVANMPEARADHSVAFDNYGQPERDCRWLEARAASPIDVTVSSSGERIRIVAQPGARVELVGSSPLQPGWRLKTLTSAESRARAAAGRQVARVVDLNVGGQPNGMFDEVVRTSDVPGQSQILTATCEKVEPDGEGGWTVVDSRELIAELVAGEPVGEQGAAFFPVAPAEDQQAADEAEYGRHRRQKLGGEFDAEVQFPDLGARAGLTADVLRTDDWRVGVGAGVSGNAVRQPIDLPNGGQMEATGQVFGAVAEVQARLQMLKYLGLEAGLGAGVCYSSKLTVPTQGGRIEVPSETSACGVAGVKAVIGKGDGLSATIGATQQSGLSEAVDVGNLGVGLQLHFK